MIKHRPNESLLFGKCILRGCAGNMTVTVWHAHSSVASGRETEVQAVSWRSLPGHEGKDVVW